MSRANTSKSPNGADTDPNAPRTGEARPAEERRHHPEPVVVEDGLKVLYG